MSTSFADRLDHRVDLLGRAVEADGHLVGADRVALQGAVHAHPVGGAHLLADLVGQLDLQSVDQAVELVHLLAAPVGLAAVEQLQRALGIDPFWKRKLAAFAGKRMPRSVQLSCRRVDGRPPIHSLDQRLDFGRLEIADEEEGEIRGVGEAVAVGGEHLVGS